MKKKLIVVILYLFSVFSICAEDFNLQKSRVLNTYNDDDEFKGLYTKGILIEYVSSDWGLVWLETILLRNNGFVDNYPKGISLILKIWLSGEWRSPEGIFLKIDDKLVTLPYIEEECTYMDNGVIVTIISGISDKETLLKILSSKKIIGRVYVSGYWAQDTVTLLFPEEVMVFIRKYSDETNW